MSFVPAFNANTTTNRQMNKNTPINNRPINTQQLQLVAQPSIPFTFLKCAFFAS